MTDHEDTTGQADTTYPLRWRAVSVLTSFPVILSLTIVTVVLSVQGTGSTARLFGGVLLFFFIALPGIAGAFLYLTGRVSDLEIRDRHEREPILIVGMISSLVGVYILYLISAPEALFRLGVLQLLMLIIIFWINGFWKVSVHAISWGSALPPIFVFTPLIGVAMTPFVFLMAMSRFRLDCHTFLQVIVGFGVGALISGVLFVPFL
ncbi:MAG: hypothetical protein MUP66_00930 [Candidatus Nanohaloarchaeota archaeon QJJ-5]|nr:hypothetical protein [Candidatus Nanohaloarchaeota archaeon QJJ-5]